MRICFATNNAHKIEEVKSLLSQDIIGLKDIECSEELPETSNTLQGNALQKAQYVWDNYNVPCFADDTGLEVLSLNKEPGIYSARYAGEQRSNIDNMNLLLKNLKGQDNRQAQFRTVIALILSKSETITFEGIVEGEIIENPSGIKGFGYDPIFKPSGYDITFAEMDMAQKNLISHRGQAVRKLIKYLNSI